MNTLHWYIQPLSHDHDTSQRMAYTAQARGIKVISDPYHGFGYNWNEILPWWRDGPVTFLGSINALKSCQQFTKAEYELWDWCDWKQLRPSYFMSYWGEYMLSQNYCFLPLAEVIRRQHWLHSWYGKAGKLFIKPDTNDKVFDGQVVHFKNADAWVKSILVDSPSQHLLCVVARPETIHSEYRLVIHNEKVIAASSYRKDGFLEMIEGCPADAKEVAETAARKWSPHPIYVMDVAETDEGEHKIVDCGSVNVAGFYACKLEPIVDAIISFAADADGDK